MYAHQGFGSGFGSGIFALIRIRFSTRILDPVCPERLDPDPVNIRQIRNPDYD